MQQADHAGWRMHNYLEGVKVRLCWCQLFKLCVCEDREREEQLQKAHISMLEVVM